jgi:hypothetical protein
MSTRKILLATGLALGGIVGGVVAVRGRRGEAGGGSAEEPPQLSALKGREPKRALEMIVRVLRGDGERDAGDGNDLDRAALVRHADALSDAVRELEDAAADAERGNGASPAQTREAVARAIAVEYALDDVLETLRACRDCPMWAVEFADERDSVAEWADGVAHNVMQDTNSSMAWRGASQQSARRP